MKIDELSPTTTNSNRLSYNGKELDKDLNWYHYGARFYDPAIGRWWVVDAADEFNTPYGYVGNKPVVALDVDGNFERHIHGNITRAAWAAYNKKNPNGKYSYNIVRFVQLVDLYGFGADVHFDSKQNYNEISDQWAYINKSIENITYENGWVVGHLLHTIQDFYSHSNYIELYIAYHVKEHGSLPELDAIPTYKDGIKNKEFKDNFLVPYLHTGDFSVLDWFLDLVGLKDLGPRDHKYVNHDGQTSNNHEYAKNVAERATVNALEDMHGD